MQKVMLNFPKGREGRRDFRKERRVSLIAL